MSWKAEVKNGTVWVTPDNSEQLYRLSAGEAWDLGDDLLIAAGRVWQEIAGTEYKPTWAEQAEDRQFLDERATGVLFNEEQMDRLRALAAERGQSVPQLIRQEMLATMEFVDWAKLLEVSKDAEGEHGQGHAVPAVDDAVAVSEPVTQAEDHGDEVQDHGEHRR